MSSRPRRNRRSIVKLRAIGLLMSIAANLTQARGQQIPSPGEVYLPGRGVRHIEFLPAEAITGQVTDESGGAIAGAKVTIQDAGGHQSSAITGKDGTFTFPERNSGSFRPRGFSDQLRDG